MKTRIAPTPSGLLHLGNVLSFSLTAALARRVGAAILLRIDDLDRERVEREYLEDIFVTLRYLGIPWDEGPKDVLEFERSWSQVHRLGMYREALDRLRFDGRVFACDCSRSKVLRDGGDGVYPGTCRERGLALDMEGCSWRVRTGGFGGGMVEEGPGGARLPVEMTDFVVRKKDGFPAYQLTSVVDDLYYGIDLVVRGDDLRASTAAQLWLAGVLGREKEFGRIRFCHHPLLMDAEGGKLSKSEGAMSVRYLRGRGVTAAELFGMIAHRLGMDAAVGTWEELATIVEDFIK